MCWLCHRDVRDEHYVLIVLHDGRLVSVCDVCMEKADSGPDTVLSYEEAS
jgi:hypothetical protein